MSDHQFKYYCDIKNVANEVLEYQLEYFGPYNNPDNIFAYLSSLWSIIDNISKIKFVQYVLLIDNRKLMEKLLLTKIEEDKIDLIVFDLGSKKILSLFALFEYYKDTDIPEDPELCDDCDINLDIRFRNSKSFEKKICKDYLNGMNLVYGNYDLVSPHFHVTDFKNKDWFWKIINYDLLENFIYMIEHHHGPTDDPSDYLYQAIHFRATKIIKYICKNKLVINYCTLNLILEKKYYAILNKVIRVKWPFTDDASKRYELIFLLERCTPKIRDKINVLMENTGSKYTRKIIKSFHLEDNENVMDESVHDIVYENIMYPGI